MSVLTYSFLLPSLYGQTFCLQGISSLLRPEGQIQLNLLLLGSVKYKHLWWSNECKSPRSRLFFCCDSQFLTHPSCHQNDQDRLVLVVKLALSLGQVLTSSEEAHFKKSKTAESGVCGISSMTWAGKYYRTACWNLSITADTQNWHLWIYSNNM